ncbi:hypothetical protein [Sulfitobacter sp. R18_1]|uniref:hypothetical protein n=1 Tax=Sulfitobacter sp. R18_1 TaxID=2821104 RepID=UPI001ADB3B47|nr:hypothetical protein [Sulfitobacter sp. R18_1]MBO9428568.1 hypothetical protein [Sulfitobacter sp. R18_1]
MPGFKSSPKKKKTKEGEALKGKSAADLFNAKSQREILNSSLKSMKDREGVYKGLFKR